jgi:hypothetical protein
MTTEPVTEPASQHPYVVSWRDQLAAHLVDAVLLVGTRRFRRLVRDGARGALVDALREPKAPAPVFNPDFFAGPTQSASSQEVTDA